MEMVIVIVLVIALFAFSLMPKKEDESLLETFDEDNDQEFDREEYEAQRLREERIAQEEYEIQQERAARMAQEELADRETQVAQTERGLRFAQEEIDERAARLDRIELDANDFQQELVNQKTAIEQQEQEARSAQYELEARAEEISRKEYEVNVIQERLEQERLEQERLEQERLEQERLEQEEIDEKSSEQDEADDSEPPLNENQIDLIQSTWKMILPVKEQTAELFYRKLFQIDPSTKPLFKGDMKAQGEKLITSLNLVVNSLKNLDHVVPALQDMGKRHVDYGVQAEHYESVGSALLWTFEQGLGKDFTDEAKQAWATAYGLVASVMKNAT